jgi:transposase
MVPRILQLHPKTYGKLARLRKEAERDGAYRVARRLHAVLLNSQGRSSGELAVILQSPRSRVSEWLANYEAHGVDGLLEGFRSGRPPRLTVGQVVELSDIVESGPVAYGFDSGIWTSPMIARVIEEEFGLLYHPGHVRKLLHGMRFSVQRPRRVLARADAAEQDRWHRRTFPNLKKKARRENLALIFTDEASFRQDSTLHATWSPIGRPPEVLVTGQRKSVKILGAVEIYRAEFHYREDEVFNAETYLTFLRELARHYRRRGAILVQDNASYHKDGKVWAWFATNREWLEVRQLPPYSPQFNPAERLWQHTRNSGTHNRYFVTKDELVQTLRRVFGEMQSSPSTIRGYLSPFCA